MTFGWRFQFLNKRYCVEEIKWKNWNFWCHNWLFALWVQSSIHDREVFHVIRFLLGWRGLQRLKIPFFSIFIRWIRKIYQKLTKAFKLSISSTLWRFAGKPNRITRLVVAFTILGKRVSFTWKTRTVCQNKIYYWCSIRIHLSQSVLPVSAPKALM